MKRFAFFATPGLGNWPRSPPFSSQLRLCPSGNYASRESWHGGDSGEANSHNFWRRRSTLLSQSRHMTMAFSLQSHNCTLNSSVNAHTALGGGWPRWQPLNVDVATPYWRDTSQRVSWQTAMTSVAYSFNRTTSLRWWWSLNYVIFYYPICINRKKIHSSVLTIPLQSYHGNSFPMLSPVKKNSPFTYINITIQYEPFLAMGTLGGGLVTPTLLKTCYAHIYYFVLHF